MTKYETHFGFTVIGNPQYVRRIIGSNKSKSQRENNISFSIRPQLYN